jgi:hypothetical protein
MEGEPAAATTWAVTHPHKNKAVDRNMDPFYFIPTPRVMPENYPTQDEPEETAVSNAR